ncbi:MAG: energy-coupling factor ABC transporter ATP-binding protein [bacterium]|nr:energy-coupling factor ABC transporter ATP-binding protein [bacterium]
MHSAVGLQRTSAHVAMVSLVAENLHYAWRLPRDVVAAIGGVNAEFRAGVPHVICGPSGSGKTTLALLLTGHILPNEGSVLLDGFPIAQRRHEAAYVFQFPETLFFEDTVARELEQIAGSSCAESAKRYLEKLGICFDDVADLHPFHLSAGYGRLVATALQAARQPRVLVADEPTIGLDCRFHRRMISLLHECVTTDRIVIAVTHDVELMSELGGRAWVLSEGKLVWSGDTHDLLGQPPLMEQFGLEA